ncbi:MAG: S8 family serine peptidase [Thermoplasmata archaeon]|nr:MAG: S8 family serine peptidase [Thermoplasmata archaeon]
MMRKIIYNVFIIILMLVSYIAPTYSLGTEIVADNNPTQVNWWENWSRDKNHNRIDDLIEEEAQKNMHERISIYVDYDHKPTKMDIKSLSSFDLEIVYIVKCIDTVILKNAKISDIYNISHLNGVVMIELQGKPIPHLDVSVPAIKVRDSSEYSPFTAWELGYTGKGINIAILDAGVDDGHESLAGKFVAGVDFTQIESVIAPRDGSYNPDDDESAPYGGHGTYCAGITLGTGGSEGSYKGVAIDARLIDVKAHSSRGSYRLQAYDWIIEHKDTDWNGNGPDEYDGIDVVSESYGEGWISGMGVSDGQDSDSRAANEVVEAGIVFISSVGNDGPDNNGIEPPAAADKVISVGAIDDQGTINREDDVIVDFSSRGPREDDGDDDPYDELKPDVVAPGENIMSTNHAIVGQDGTGYSSVSGTSFAAPHVAGITALLLEADSDLSPSQIKEIFRQTAEARGDPYDDELSSKYNTAYGFGIIDAYNACQMAIECNDVQVTIDYPIHDDIVQDIFIIQGKCNTLLDKTYSIYVTIDDSSFDSNLYKAEGITNWEVIFDTTRFENGPHTIYARAESDASYSPSVSVDIIIYNSPSKGNNQNDNDQATQKPSLDLNDPNIRNILVIIGLIIIISIISSIVIVMMRRKHNFEN